MVYASRSLAERIAGKALLEGMPCIDIGNGGYASGRLCHDAHLAVRPDTNRINGGGCMGEVSGVRWGALGRLGGSWNVSEISEKGLSRIVSYIVACHFFIYNVHLVISLLASCNGHLI